MINTMLKEIKGLFDAMEKERDQYRDDREELIFALESIIDDAQENADEYADRWGDYRKEKQQSNYDRVSKAYDVLNRIKGYNRLRDRVASEAGIT